MRCNRHSDGGVQNSVRLLPTQLINHKPTTLRSRINKESTIPANPFKQLAVYMFQDDRRAQNSFRNFSLLGISATRITNVVRKNLKILHTTIQNRLFEKSLPRGTPRKPYTLIWPANVLQAGVSSLLSLPTALNDLVFARTTRSIRQRALGTKN